MTFKTDDIPTHTVIWILVSFVIAGFCLGFAHQADVEYVTMGLTTMVYLDAELL